MASFPQALEEEGFEARIMMPKYGTINDRKFRLHDVLRLSDIEVPLRERTELLNVKVTALPSSKIQTYFLYNEKYFKRNGLFTDVYQGNDLKGNTEKVIFFNVGVLETLVRLGWRPDIIHCHDWYASLIPLLLKTVYRDHEFFRGIKTVLTIHNAYRQGVLPFKVFEKLLPEEVSAALHRSGENVNLLYTGVENADMLTTTSERHAREIVRDEIPGCGLKKVIGGRKEELHGIPNGIDVRQWNPSTDKLIKKRFGADRLEGKQDNRAALAEEARLELEEGRPLVGLIMNFDDFQGAALIEKSLKKLAALDIRLLICGSGDKKYEKAFREFAEAHPDRVSLSTDCPDSFLHLAIAGLDMLVMAGKIEACGMLQMFAMSYGTVPVVYDGGGIADTVEEVSGDKGTGFIFRDYTPDGLVRKLKEAVALYGDSEKWQELVLRAMSRDFAWKEPAEEYGRLYSELLGS